MIVYIVKEIVVQNVVSGSFSPILSLDSQKKNDVQIPK